MKPVVASLALVALLAGAALTTDAMAQNPQQERMKSCNTQASTQSLSGDARKSFMTDCLAGKTAAAAPAPQTPQDRMKSCNTQATTQKLMGDDRKKFMSTCLKG